MFPSDNGACPVDVQGRLVASCLGDRLATRAGRPLITGPVPGVILGPGTTFQAYESIRARVDGANEKQEISAR